MDPSTLASSLGGAVIVLLLAGLVGLVAALVAGVWLLRGRRVDPFLAAASVGVPGTAALVAAALELGGASPEVTGAIGYRLIGLFFAAPGALFLALFAGVAGVRATPRGRLAPALGLLGVLAVLATVIGGGVVEEDLLYPGLRAGLYGLVGLLAVLAMVAGGDERGVGPEASAAAGASFALLVALGEVSAEALEELFLLTAAGGMEVGLRETFVHEGLAAVIAPMAPWHQGAAAAAAVVGVLAVIPAVRRGRWRALSALAWVALAPAASAFGDPGAEVLVDHAEQAPASTPAETPGP